MTTPPEISERIHKFIRPEPVKILTDNEYLKIYKQLNNNETTTKYNHRGVFLLYCDDVIIKTVKQLEELIIIMDYTAIIFVLIAFLNLDIKII